MTVRPPLWDHQQRAIDKGLRLPGFGLFMDMGTGKTRTALEMMELRRSRIGLVVAPVAAIPVWAAAVQEGYGETWDTVVLQGHTQDRAERLSNTLKSGRPTIFITNYESVWREPLKSKLLNIKWDHVVLDEAHRIKTPGSRVSKFISTLGRRATYRLALTGTPSADKPVDVYALYRFLDPRAFGTNYERFLERYAVRIWNGFTYQIVNYQNERDFRDRAYKIAYRVSQDEVLDLPPELDINWPVNLPSSSMKLYKEFKKELIATLPSDDVIVAGNTLVRDLRLQQITSGRVKTEDGTMKTVNTTKEDALSDWLGDVKEPVVVFCLFVSDLDAVERAAKKNGLRYGEVSGSLNDTVNGKYPETVDVMGVQMRSGSASIDLTRSAVAVYYSIAFNLTDYQQSRARIRRPGQTRPVRYYHMYATGTIDTLVQKSMRKKISDSAFFYESVVEGQTDVDSDFPE